MDITFCLFCEKGLEEGDLHQVLTFDANVKSFICLLLKCIQLLSQPEPLTFCDCRVIDGAAVVHFLPVSGVLLLMAIQRIFLSLTSKCNCRAAQE